MAITLTDDVDTVDISEAEVTKRREPRIAILTQGNRAGEIIQGFGSEGFKLDIEGVWIVADSSRPDARPILDRWRRDNVLVKYDDGSYKAWFTIRSFSTRLVPGAPGNEIAAWYAIELSEAIRIQTSTATGGPEDNPIVTQQEVDDLPLEGTFTTWAQTWAVLDADETWRMARIDLTNNLVYFMANDRIKSRTLAAGTVGLNDTTYADPTVGNLLTKNPIASIRDIYHVAIGGTQQIKVFKNGALLFTSAAIGFSIQVLAISHDGKYIAVIADTGFDRLQLWTGS